MGEVIQYDQDTGADKQEVKQPGDDVDYYADSSTTYNTQPKGDNQLPPGNPGFTNLPERDQMNPATSTVIPDQMKQTLYEQLTYPKAAERVAARFKSAATMADIMRNTGPDVIKRARSVPLQAKRFSPTKGFWTFAARGSTGETYTVRIKGVRKSQAEKKLSTVSVKVSCTCDFFRWQGPEHWAKRNGFLYGRPRGTASTPDVKDPKGRHWVCKHIAAALNQARTYRFSSVGSWSLDGELEPMADPGRVVARYRTKLARPKTACVVGVATVGKETILLKVRDRNYVPRIKVVREMVAGTEVAHVYDTWTGWSEGINEYGISLVSSALLVEVDEGEKKETDGNSGTGQKIRQVLGARTMDAAIEIVMGNTIKGCTIISDGRATVLIEYDGNKDKGGLDPVLKHLKGDVVTCRTNHGVFLEGAGYTEDYKDGTDLKSSKVRKTLTEKTLAEATRVSDIAGALARTRKKDRKSPNNAIRATDNMFTSTQIVMRPKARTMMVYLIPGEVDFLGIENRLPKKRKPKVKVEVFGFTGWDSNNPKPVSMTGNLEVFRLFTYGSMMGSPVHGNAIIRSYKATLKGHHRAYNRSSQVRGGTLVIGTEPGGEIEGVIHEYPVSMAHRMLGQVDRREGFRTERDRSLNAYLRGHFAIQTPEGEEWVVAYLSNPKGPSYLKPLAPKPAAKRIQSDGSEAKKYLRGIVKALGEYKVKDSYVSDISEKVEQMKGAAHKREARGHPFARDPSPARVLARWLEACEAVKVLLKEDGQRPLRYVERVR